MDKYNFDEIICRHGTYSTKYDKLPAGLSKKDLEGTIPLWIADMDFMAPKPVIDAIKKRADNGIFGYTYYDENEDLKKSIKDWFKEKHDWEVDSEDMFYSPGVVPAISFLVNILTEENDKIIIQPPVYNPFKETIEANNRIAEENPLIYKDNKYTIDFEDYEAKISQPDVKGLLFCSPHNPVGRVWTREELEKLVFITEKYNKWIISDEIHGDITRKQFTHIPVEKISDTFINNVFTCTAPSKTFNLAGMQMSNIIIKNKDVQEKWTDFVKNKVHISMVNPFSVEATIAAYTKGQNWLDEVMDYMDGNIEFALNYIKEKMPQVKVVYPEGTYLLWVDFNICCQEKDKIETLFVSEAKVILNNGDIFGKEGIGFKRINVGCPRSVLKECLKRIHHTLCECNCK